MKKIILFSVLSLVGLSSCHDYDSVLLYANECEVKYNFYRYSSPGAMLDQMMGARPDTTWTYSFKIIGENADVVKYELIFRNTQCDSMKNYVKQLWRETEDSATKRKSLQQ